ncbi:MULTISPECIES: acyl carrier protein [unclassified Streptomyces]|uniref:acyl carrier protein n=1 Tax=unclassified Streptomyces TaxID=2593676 RepID=UPI0005F94408|nr:MULTISPECIES: acyl carrier protein [unclassified Streptomyces]KJY30191.1 methoxymalonate biosynthesis protein [Streptomyces sp. NRRL S-495]KOV09927.1 methoxymalonate biosynthesis protein [Streptomyces sp. XY431]
MTTANTPNTHDLEKELLGFLETRTGTAWDADTDLFDAGGLSSLFAMQVVVHLEKTYAIAVRGADLRLDNFRTVRRMAELVDRLRVPAAGGRNG